MNREIRVALAGIGNCSSSLVQGIEHYRERASTAIGMSHPKVGGYVAKDIKFVAAFDVDKRKVGKDLSEAIFAEPNNVRKFSEPAPLGVKVAMAQPLDGISTVVGDKMQISDSKPSNLSRLLKDARTDILVNLTPTGASKASEMYAEAALRSDCAFINATPARIASDRKWQLKYRQKNLPVAGDDVMDQIGSTILHKNLLSFLVKRGLHLDETYQLDIGGGTESQIALDKQRYEIKRRVKTASVAAAVPYKFPIVAGSSDFVDFMENRRTSYFWIRGEYFAETGFTLDIRLSLEDGPSCAGALVDIVRMVRVAMDRGLGGPLNAVSAYGFKAPPQGMSTEEAEEELDSFLQSTKRK